jgi:hypothetical protein
VTSHAQNNEPRPISRRRIVRSAATLAWAVPAVQVATAVPAFAGSGCCSLTVDGSAGWVSGDLNYIDVPLTITNACGTSVSGLTVTLYVCGLSELEYAGTNPVGWSHAGSANKSLTADGSQCFTVTYVSGLTLGANGSTSPTFRLKSKAYVGSGKRPAGTITATVSTAGCSSPTTAMALPQVG